MTDYRPLLTKMIDSGDMEALADAFEMCRAIEVEGSSTVLDKDGNGSGIIYQKKNFELAHKFAAEIRKVANDLATGAGNSDALDLYYRTHLFDAPHKFDSFCIYIEKDRELKKRFYLPRRKQLLPCVNALQELEEGKITLLGISEPPGVGKTTLAEFFLAWTVGRNPFLPNLTGSHNNAFLTGMYGELLRIFDEGGEYRWADVFPGLQVISTNAKDMMIGIGYSRSDDMRFKSLEFSSIGSGNAGKVRAMNILYCDDLVNGIETAMSMDRLDKLWQMYYTDLRQRKVGTRAKELHIATRWSVHDVLGRLEREYADDPSAKFIKFPALDKNDESNFNYPFGLGYTTDDLRRQRDIMDDVSWKALYMNEPIEREGLLFHPDELRRFFVLPDAEPDSILAICDTKEQGSDYLSCPVFYQYGTDYYMADIIFSNGKVEVLEERVANLMFDRKVHNARIESNRGGTIFAQNVQNRLKKLGCMTNITTKWTQTNKETRIQSTSGMVKSHILFYDQSAYPSKEYREAMNMLCSYSMMGKNKYDDFPDSLSMFVDWMLSGKMNLATILKRPF